MKKDFRERDLMEEGEAPPNWSPEDDQDESWRTIVRLAKEADNPSMPPNAHFEAIRQETRRELLALGLIRQDKAANSDLTFGAWLKLMVTGGGMGAQVMRIGAAACVAFGLGIQFAGSDEPEMRSSGRDVAMANTMTDSSVMNTDANNTSASSSGAGLLPTPTPVATRPVRSDTGFESSVAIEKSVLEENPGSSWTSTAPAASVWEFSNGRPNAVTVGAASSPGSREDLLEQALDHLQVLKFSSLVEQDEGNLAHIRRVEQVLSEMLNVDSGSGRAPSADALEKYRRAEQALAAHRYHMAMQNFEEASLSAPGSSLAFLAQFQIGRIAYEETQDYDLALESFQRCLDRYPAEQMPGEYRRYIEDRVEILRAGEADDWKSLSHWHAAQNAMTPVQAAKNLLDVVIHSPSDKLAADAAERLKDIVIADSSQRTIDHQKVVDALRNRVDAEQSSPYAARIQFTVAEISARRSQNLGQALMDYRKALELKPDEQTRRNIRSRMTVIMNYRLTGLPSVE